MVYMAEFTLEEGMGDNLPLNILSRFGTVHLALFVFSDQHIPFYRQECIWVGDV